MPIKGRVREWRDDKGFGFVEPMLPGPAVFVHIKAFTRPGRRPKVGDLLIYELGRDPNGRPRAERVEFSLASKAPTPDRPKPSPRTWAVPAAVLVLAAMGVAGALGKIPILIVGVYFGMSLVAYVLYAWDKVSARGGRWRTQESTLLMAGLLGGWPGALIAQESLRHKTAKESFQAAFWGSMLINLGALLWLYLTDFSVLAAI